MTPKEVVKFAKEKGVRIVDLRFIDLPGTLAALLDSDVRAQRGHLRGRPRLRRLVDPRLPDHRRVGHAADPRLRRRADGSVHGGADDRAHLQRQGSGDGQGLHPRSALRGPEGRGLREEGRAGRHHLHRARARVLLLRLDPLRPELQPRLLLHRLRGGRLEHRQGRHAGPAEPRLQAALQAGLLPGAADGPVPGHPLRHGAGAGVGGRARRGAPPRGGHRRADRDRHALRHPDQDGGQGVLVQVLRQEHRQEVGQDRHLHAQAAVPGQRLRHAHPPVALEERQEPLLRARRLRGHLEDLPVLHRRHPQARARAARLHRAVHQQLQAAGAGLRGADQPRVQPAEPLGGHPHPDVLEGGGRQAHRVPDARSDLQPVSLVRGLRDGRPRRRRQQDRSGQAGGQGPLRAAARPSRRRSSSCPAPSTSSSTTSRRITTSCSRATCSRPDLIETWIEYKRKNEVDPIRLRPHPYEFALYYDI